MAKLVKHLTLGFNSGHDLTICEFEPRMRLYTDLTEPAWDSLCPLSLPLPSSCSLSLTVSVCLCLSVSLSQNNKLKNKRMAFLQVCSKSVLAVASPRKILG